MTNEETTKAQCKGKTAAGQPCRMKPTADGYCFNHSPKQAAARAQADAEAYNLLVESILANNRLAARITMEWLARHNKVMINKS